MEKLELKHLTPYLPYGLKIKTSNNQGNVIRQIHGIDISEEFILACGYINYIESDNYYPYTLKSCKPILRPLSDLKEDNYYFTYCNNSGFMMKGKNETYIRLNDLEYLFKNHFDVFGLIDKGLAISYSDVQSMSNEG